ncbi:MAG: single-stranded-DNA-specific exonuclease RecJ [Flavobacteriales bacterium]|nr:single-stranded-DNA-specific exonuclease RecJ [Flavobacteriales bacterium]
MSSPKTKRWRAKQEPDPAAVQQLVHDRCPLPGAKLLAQRGITDPSAASAFFRPSLDQLHDPFLMADMDLAVERIERALGDNETIMVYGDYDVDGTTAVALVHSFLAKYTSHLSFYIPDRYAEGYGISYQGIDHAAERGVALIIALDCGIKAVDKVAYAASKGIDLIICDHHRPGDVLPAAVAVLDPKRADCQYPFKELSGCGIGFKLVQGFAQRNNIPFDDLAPLLDLVAVSIACDIVPVNGENRVLGHFGLYRLNTEPRPGLRAMMDMANVKKRLDITDLVFTIGPRINAAGRIEHGRLAVELLLAHDRQQAAEIAQRVDINNSHRQELDKDMTLAALDRIGADKELADAWSTVIFDTNWHKGVIGIVASRLIEQYYRPTVVLTESNGKAVGSARSVKGFDVYEAISGCSDLMDQFGGHMYAAGLTMPLENVQAFQQRFEQVVRATIDPALRTPEEEVDLESRLSAFDEKLVRILRYMAPYGPANMRPVFLVRGVLDKGRARIVGEDHLKMELYHPDAPGHSMDAIAFRMAHHFDLVKSGKPFSVLGVLEENEWQGRTTLQLNIKDIKPGVEGLLESEVVRDRSVAALNGTLPA